MLNVKHDFTVHPKAAAPCVRDIGHTLDDVYGSYSIEKARAYTYCKELCDRYDGYDFLYHVGEHVRVYSQFRLYQSRR